MTNKNHNNKPSVSIISSLSPIDDPAKLIAIVTDESWVAFTDAHVEHLRNDYTQLVVDAKQDIRVRQQDDAKSLEYLSWPAIRTTASNNYVTEIISFFKLLSARMECGMAGRVEFTIPEDSPFFFYAVLMYDEKSEFLVAQLAGLEYIGANTKKGSIPSPTKILNLFTLPRSWSFDTEKLILLRPDTFPASAATFHVRQAMKQDISNVRTITRKMVDNVKTVIDSIPLDEEQHLAEIIREATVRNEDAARLFWENMEKAFANSSYSSDIKPVDIITRLLAKGSKRTTTRTVQCPPNIQGYFDSLNGEKTRLLREDFEHDIDPVSLRKKLEFLWGLLDDIDTYGDMFKPEQTAYVNKVNAKAAERFKVLSSDGYSLFDPRPEPEKTKDIPN